MHTIRLRHPWQHEVVEEGSLWSRKFNWPAKLAEGEVVWLVVDGGVLATAPLLNNQPLTATDAGKYEVTPLLAGHNTLVLQHAESPSADSGDCPFDVRLEIEHVG